METGRETGIVTWSPLTKGRVLSRSKPLLMIIYKETIWTAIDVDERVDKIIIATL